MSNEIEELRKTARAAQVSGKGQYIEVGQHELEIIQVLYKRTVYEGKVKETYIAEFKVLSSTNPSHEVGSTRTYAENPNNDGWMGRFKAFLLAAMGFDLSSGRITPEMDSAFADVIVAMRHDEERIKLGWPENCLKGRRVRCEGMAGLSRGGTTITNKKWTPLPTQPQAS